MEENQVHLECKKTEEELRTMIQRLQLSKDSARIGIWDLDLRNNNLIWDKRMFELYGIQSKDFGGAYEAWKSGVHPDDIIKTDAEFQDAIAGKAEFHSQFRVVWPDGQIRFIEAHALVISNAEDAPERVIGVNWDITEKTQVEEALLENQKRYKKAQSMGQVGNWEYSPATTNFWASDEAKKIYGFHPDSIDFTTEMVESCIPERERVHQALVDLIEQDRKYDLVFDIITYDTGIRKTIHSIAEAERDAQGRAVKITGVITDITRHMQAEKALFISEQRYDLAMKASKDGLFDWNLLTNEIYYSPNWKKILGYKNNELPNDFSVWEKFTHPKDVKRSWKMLTEVINKKKDRFEMEFKMKHKDGHWVDILSRADAVFDEAGKAIRIVGTHIDITERKHVEVKLIAAKEEAEENEIKFRTLFNELKEGVTLTHNGVLVDLNDIMLSKLGFQNKAEVIGKSLLDFMTPESRQIALDEIKKVQGNKIKTSHTEFVFNSKDGTQFIVAMNGSKIEFKGKIYGLSVHHDITESKRVEAELVLAKEKAEESDRLKSAFLANMSHEIRTPMNGILGFTSLLKEPGLSGENQQKYISVIEKSGDRMLDTINDIIDISKIESEQVNVSVSDINLNEQLDELLEFFRPEAEKKHIHLSIMGKLPDQQFIIKSDKEKLNSILTNLIKNAIKFTHTGHIEFACSLSEYNEQTMVEFFVRDTGIGISIERQKAIFDRFVQADIEDKHAFQGSGLGLAISKAYIEMLGGEIWVESQEGLGSKFSFTLPQNANGVKTLPNIIVDTKPSNFQQSAEKRFKVLLVDDEEYVITYLSIILEDYVKELFVAKTGIEAVEMCHDNPDIDIVLMDIKIPEINGYEATRRIREFNKEVFILAQTAYAQTGDREKSIQAGCDDYIAKPIKKRKLLEIIGGRFRI